MMGGFIILEGVLLFGLCSLILFGFIDPGLLLEREQVTILAFVMVAIGLLDVVAAIIISRW